MVRESAVVLAPDAARSRAMPMRGECPEKSPSRPAAWAALRIRSAIARPPSPPNTGSVGGADSGRIRSSAAIAARPLKSSAPSPAWSPVPPIAATPSSVNARSLSACSRPRRMTVVARATVICPLSCSGTTAGSALDGGMRAIRPPAGGSSALSRVGDHDLAAPRELAGAPLSAMYVSLTRQQGSGRAFGAKVSALSQRRRRFQVVYRFE